ncbi:MAG: sulfatase-like hydrolase/transferase [Enhydrobacter sp.]|nr:sulfatase-like hydrolase/transferase [Enhydrobacter sp.]
MSNETAADASANPIKNVLLISIDDLNDWIGPLGGHPQAFTPNLNRFAKQSVVFEEAMATSASCSPSRTAFLYGKAPWNTGVYTNQEQWTDVYPREQRLSLIGRLRDAGWDTTLAGKLTHGTIDRADWSLVVDEASERFPAVSEAVKSGLLRPTLDFGPIPDDTGPMVDERQADFLMSQMQSGDVNQLWALGLHRPHSPFVVPQRYFDLIPETVAPAPGMSPVPFDPTDTSAFDGLPPEALDMIKRKMGRMLGETGEYLDLVRAYLATIAYMDDIVGRVLDQLEKSGLADNTLVVLWSDQGLQFGEKQAFRKFTLWEPSLHVPFMIRGPGMDPKTVSNPVSLLDIYPTLASLLGVTTPYALDGHDLTPVLTSSARPEEPAISAWNSPVVKGGEPRLVVTVRTADYRPIRYWDGALELYDHRVDPYEQVNLVPPGTTPDAALQAVIDGLVALLPKDMATPAKLVVPDAPVLTAVTDDTGTPGDRITGDTTPTIHGTASAFATVRLFRDGVRIGTTLADALGAWSLTDPTVLHDGHYRFTAVATTPHGHGSVESAGFVVTIQTNDPARPALVMTLDAWKEHGAAEAAANGPWSTITIQNKPDALEALSPGRIAKLGAQGVTDIDSKTDRLALTAAQYDAFLKADIDLAAADLVTLRDVGTRLATLLESDFGANPIDRLDASDDRLSLTVAQYTDFLQAGVAFTGADLVTLSDTGARLATVLDAGFSARNVDRLDAIDDRLALSLAQFNALGSTIVANADSLAVVGKAATDQVFNFSRQIFGSDDSVVGSTGRDELSLKGDYSAGLTFGSGSLVSIDKLAVGAGFDYRLTTRDANVTAGALLNISANRLGAGDDVTVNGSAEADGRLEFRGGAGINTFIGGQGNDIFHASSGQDVLAGGGGADRFLLGGGADYVLAYASASESTGSGYDTVDGFDAAAGHFLLWDDLTVDAIDAPITKGTLQTGSAFDRQLEAAVDGSRLLAHHAALFTPDAGNLAGNSFLVVDINGTAGYQAGQDLVVRLVSPTGSITASNFF